MPDDIDLPDTTALDQWGAQLNAAIEEVDDKANQALAEIAALTDGETDTTGFVPSSSLGTANGVATLDNAKQVPTNQLGNITPGIAGAAPAQHVHNLVDEPEASRAITLAPVITWFNNTSKMWTPRATLTPSASRPVIWAGDAAPPSDAIANVDLAYFPESSGTTVTDPTDPTPPPNTDPVTGVTLSTPVITVNGSAYNVTGTFTNGSTAQTYAYIQIAVRGPNGESADTAFNNSQNLTASQQVALSGSGNAGSVGTWRAWIAYNQSGGSSQASWIDGPVQTFTIASTGGAVTPPPSGDVGNRTIPLIGRSGLPWNSGVFYNGGDVASANNFFNWRNRPGDSIMYFTGRAQWNDLNWLRSDLASWPGYRIISVPSQPGSSGTGGGLSLFNDTGANASSYTFWQNWGTAAKNAGWNDGRTIVRLNWEANGNWYNWAWLNQGAAQFVNAYKNVVNAIRSTAPKMLFDLTLNKDSVNGGVNWSTQIASPLLSYFDILGLDWYDSFPAQNNSSAFTSAQNSNPGFNAVASFCRSNGKMLWLNEWSVDHRPDGPSGGDDPFYISSMFNLLSANADVVAGETYYEDPGTNGQNGQLSTGSFNPNAGAAYRSSTRWGR